MRGETSLRLTPEIRDGEEAHISSILVHLTPDARADISKQIAGMAGAETHDAGAPGKLIVSLETATLYEVTETVDAISRLDGVIDAVLVYHHIESPERLDDIVDTGEEQPSAEENQEVSP